MPDILLEDLRSGRNGIDSPLVLPDSQVAEAINVDWEDGPVATKRRGAVQLSTTDFDLSEGVLAMYRHVPDGDESIAELWVVKDDLNFYRLTTAGWFSYTPGDVITSSPVDVAFCTFNDKLFLAYGSSGVDRLHVYDPILDAIRRVGLAIPGVPTVADSSAHSGWPATTHWRVRVIDYDGTTVKRRSEPSPGGVEFSSGGTAPTVTQGTLPGEGETHWEIEGTTDLANGPWYVYYGVFAGNPIAIGTTSQDFTDLSDYTLDQTTLAEEIGLFLTLPSAKFLTTDGNHLLLAGSYEGGLSSRIWNTPALGSADHGDDERLVFTATVKGYIDLNEKDGGAITALSDAVQGSVWATKYRQVWKLSPTGDETAIYLPRKISNAVGCIYFKTMVSAEDANGNPIVAFLSHKGSFQVGLGGLIKTGRDVDDVWFGKNGQSRVNLEASRVVAHAVYHSDLYQIWFYVATADQTSPDTKLMLDVRRNVPSGHYGARGGWAIHTGLSCRVLCSCLFSNTIGASMSKDLKPYVAYRG